jgi:hypothetical protein
VVVVPYPYTGLGLHPSSDAPAASDCNPLGAIEVSVEPAVGKPLCQYDSDGEVPGGTWLPASATEEYPAPKPAAVSKAVAELDDLFGLELELDLSEDED